MRRGWGDSVKIYAVLSQSLGKWLLMLLTHLSRLAQMWFGSITQERKKKSSLDFSRAVKLSFSTVFLIRITSPQCALLLECLFWQCSGDAEWLRKQNPLKHYSPNSFLLTTLLVQFLVKQCQVTPRLKEKVGDGGGNLCERLGRDGTVNRGGNVLAA